MNRRGFLSSLLTTGAVALTLDPERLLWVPGKKTIFIPPPLEVFEFTGLQPRYREVWKWNAGITVTDFRICLEVEPFSPPPNTMLKPPPGYMSQRWDPS